MLNYFYKNVHVKKILKNAYIREELDGNAILIQNGSSINEALVLNKVAYEIIKILDNDCTIGEIIDILSNKFPDANINVIEKDVITYISILYKLNVVKIKEADIMYKGKVLSNHSNYELYRCAEGDFKILNNLLNSDENNKKIDIFNIGNSIDTYLPINLRSKLFNYSEDFFIIKYEDKPYGLFTIINGRNNFIKVSVIGRFTLFEEIPGDILQKFIKIATEDHKKNYNPYTSKIRLATSTKELNEITELSDIINLLNFKNVSVLKDEISKGVDLYLYDYSII